MDLAALVDFLEDAGQLGRPDMDLPWPEFDAEEYDAYQLDWDGLFAGLLHNPWVMMGVRAGVGRGRRG